MNSPPTAPLSASEAATLPGRPVDHTEWFKQEVHAHDGQLKSYLRGRYPSVRDVDDVVQESYLRIWKARSLHHISTAKAFLFRIARNLAIDSIRHESASPVDEGRVLEALTVLDTAPTPTDALLAQDIFDLMADAVGSLPERCQAVFFLHKLKGLTQKETALQLGLSERTVEKYTSQGLKKVEAYLRVHGLEDSLG